MILPEQAPVTEGLADLGNVRLSYWDTGGDGETVVLLHPGSGSAEMFPFQQPFFADAGYRVVAYSRRLQGGSEAGTDAGTYFAVDDLMALMDHLGVRRFHVVASALGGYVGLDAALVHPDRVLSLTLACSMMGIEEPAFQATLQSLRPKAFDALPMELKELGPCYRATDPEGVAEWKRRHERSGKRSPVRLRSRITWAALATLAPPVLLMTGDADLWIPPPLLREVAAHIPGSRVVVVPESGHAAHWEQPDVFNAAVLELLRSQRRLR